MIIPSGNSLRKGLHYPKPFISQHPEAPLYAGDDRQEVLRQVMSEVMSGSFPAGDGSFREAFRQTALVNLWFFLKAISADSGPYEKLTEHLHMDMANFYQESMYPGAKAAGFIGRSHYKSTVWTHGPIPWEIVRNPNISIALGGGVESRMLEFLHYAQDVFTDNEIFAWAFPKHHVDAPKTMAGFNDKMLTTPAKTWNKRKPNCVPMTAGGSTAGIHVDKLKLDDVISDKDLDSNRQSSASMRSMGNWLKSSIRTLVMDWKTSQVFLAGTRYGVDDAYEPIMNNCRRQVGYWAELDEYPVQEDGEWDIYYRMLIEDGEIIFPEAFTAEGVEKLKKDDPWTWHTQYRNKPGEIGSSDLREFEVKSAQLDFQAGEWGVWLSNNIGQPEEWYPFTRADVVQVLDPAATDRGITAQTSRSAHVCYARFPGGIRVAFDGGADYVSTSTFFSWLFDKYEKYRRYMRATGLEMRGPFKMLEGIYEEECERRQAEIGLVPVETKGDKVARIRVGLEPLLAEGLLYATPKMKALIDEEKKKFPEGVLKDVLDALEMAEALSLEPYGEEDLERWRLEEESRRLQIGRVTGY
jgi:hypothetical protein